MLRELLTCPFLRMPVLDVKLKTNKRIVLEDSIWSCIGTRATTSFTDSRAVVGRPLSTNLTHWSGENVIIPSTTAACPCG
ncbi:RING-box protein 2 [Myotis lucifugus]|uniref:RING-box protein 2 n=1 Tax=Myotis lucifugus TaxID=59463 RepID=UPI0006D72B83|nr:RING-box protein 2 [Myotis lucifugus]